MKKFKFSLEKVLEIKEIEEKVIQKNLYLVQNQIYETEESIKKLTENISIEREKVFQMSRATASSSEIMLHTKYIDGLQINLESLTQVLVQLREKESLIKAQLLEKTKEKKALDRLKEIKFEEYQKQYKKEQQLFIDDISIQNHRFKTGNF